MNPLIYAIPIFLGLMLLEHVLARRAGKSVYSFRETIGNLYCAIGQVFIETFFKVPLLAMYVFFAEFAPVSPPEGILKWVFLFVVVDFLFWLSHFVAHKVKWMWAIHGVHHQSEHYNFSVGLRMPWWHKLTSFWILIPPALLGFTITDYVIIASLQAAAQIWTHTTLIEKRLPVIEWLLVTPSHHRVHHGKNKIYIDKNFGGILSIWDYIFKTYQPETEKVRFGIPKIKTRVNPWSANLVQFIPNAFPRFSHKLSLPIKEKTFIAILTLALIAGVMIIFVFEGQLSMPERLAALCLALTTMVGLGIWMDHREDWFKNFDFNLMPPARTVSFILLMGLILF